MIAERPVHVRSGTAQGPHVDGTALQGKVAPLRCHMVLNEYRKGPGSHEASRDLMTG